jgi:hypothetical protein
MKLSIYLARTWGLCSILTSAGLLTNHKSFIGAIQHIQAHPMSILIAGVIALAVGAAQVAGFNSWARDYRGLVTLFGWLSLLKGIAILFVPGYMVRFSQIVVNDGWYTTLLALWFIAGAYLCYVGFARPRANVSLPVEQS